MTVGEEWRKALEKEGYGHTALRKGDCLKLKKFTRIWKRALRIVRLSGSFSPHSVFEFGCGGGKHLVPFALHGFQCVGIDVSPEVLERARGYIEDASRLCGAELPIELIRGDFLEYNAPDTLYDIVFHVGVIEHFLDDAERLTAIKKMFALAKPGGYVVSMVPSGTHPIRKKMKELGLGGYGIGEIDYTPEIMQKEFEICGAEKAWVLPHNIFGYLLIDDSNGFRRIFSKLFYYLMQIIPPDFFLHHFAVRHASALIGVAKKPLR